MKNLIEGRKPTFGDPEQIAWLKRQARLSIAFKEGRVKADVEENPLKASLIKDQVVVVRFLCPGCLLQHKFSFSIMETEVDYYAPCKFAYCYTAKTETLQFTPSQSH